MTTWLADVAEPELLDLGGSDAELAGVFAPAEVDEIPEHDRIPPVATDRLAAIRANHDQWSMYLDRLIGETALGEPAADPSLIIDLSSSAGRTIFPALTRFPSARIIACDPDADGLRALRRELGDDDRVAYVQAHPDHCDLVAGAADVVFGGAVLQFLNRPESTLTAVHRALRPGGGAAFVEPCQRGKVIVRMAYEMLLTDENELPEPVREYLQRRLDFMAKRLRTSIKPAKFFLHGGAKWNFSFDHMRQLRDRVGFSSVEFVPFANNRKVIERTVRQDFNGRQGFGADDLPEWAWGRVAALDKILTDDVRNGNPTSFGIVFIK